MGDDTERSVASDGSVAGEAERIAKCLLRNIGLDRMDEDDMVANVARWEVEQAAAELLRLNDEVARLRLTEAERGVLERLATRLNDMNMDDSEDVVRGLLERLK